jgi:hypothetical protein
MTTFDFEVKRSKVKAQIGQKNKLPAQYLENPFLDGLQT